MELTFKGDNIGDIANQMTVMLIELELLQLPDTEQVTEQVTEQDEPVREPDPVPEEEPEQDPVPEEEPEQDPAEAKKEAIDLLMGLYADGGKKDEVKALLAEFGVKKFGEVTDDRGVELLNRANDLCKEPA